MRKTSRQLDREIAQALLRGKARRDTSRQPTKSPSTQPTKSPSRQPPTKSPSRQSTKSPSRQSTKSPSRQPTKSPSTQPTKSPSTQPTKSHSVQLAGWWRKAVPEEDRVCYDTKTKALKAFLDTNYAIVQDYGGVDYAVSPSEFDAVNHKYNLRGKRAARTIAEAVWAAMPEGKPFCLDRIDLDALNDTSPARESSLGFRLPDYVYEAGLAAEEERYYRSLGAHARICRRCRRPLR